jgi:cyclohexadieny/prephenate dehydrogenase
MEGKDLNVKDLCKIGIVGPGLLGGSVGLALKSQQARARIVGIGHRKSSLDRAVEIGAIDEGAEDFSALAGSQLVILATPISLIKNSLEALADCLAPGAVVTDVGSTKRRICKWGEVLLKKKIEFVGSHPIAGSEKRGIDFARVDLFSNANCFVTPVEANSPAAVELVRELWTLVGMRVIVTTPDRHDRLLAAVSHLPHIAASAMVNACSEEQLKFTGTGFLDTTRIASGDVNLWHDILVSNPDKIQAAIKGFIGELDKFRRAVKNKDSKKICELLSNAKTKRDNLMKFKLEHKELEP